MGNFLLGTEDIYISDQNIKVAWVGVGGGSRLIERYIRGGGVQIRISFDTSQQLD